MTQETDERAVVKHEGPAPLEVSIPPRSLPTQAELSVMGKIAQTLVQARGHSVPKEIDSAAKAAAVLLAGWELGVKPMTAFRHIFVVNGRTEPDAQVMMGLVRAKDPSAQFIFHVYTTSACEVELRRGGKHVVTGMYTMEDARASGQLAKGGPWKQYPRDMLAWAAVKRACRLGAPDLVNAIPSVEAEEGALDLLQEPLESAQEASETAYEEDMRPGVPVQDFDELKHDPEADEELEAPYAEAEAREEARQTEMLT